MKKSIKVTALFLIVFALLTGCGNDVQKTQEAEDRNVEETAGENASETAADEENGAAGSDESISVQEKADEADTDVRAEASDDEQSTGETEDADTKETDTDADETEISATSARDLFADFIKGIGTAVVSDDYVSMVIMMNDSLKSGQEYTVPELRQAVEKDEMISGIEPEIAYAPLSCQDKQAYVFRLTYSGNTEAVTEHYVFLEDKDSLKIVFGIDSWSRRWATINENGVVSDDGSNGAGSHSYVTYAPDKDFIYRTVSDVDEQYYGYSFYDENGQAVEALNSTMNEAGETAEDPLEVVYYSEIIDGRVYYYFLGTGKLTQKTVDRIDAIAAKYNFKFDGKAAADEARDAYKEKLGVKEACDNQKEPNWKIL
ncbi:MAG: hypothetical protein J5842_02025 [Lachnospiraceae bacterium]|nr:hypothetical protein [Lachnospiraceae bacterium]